MTNFNRRAFFAVLAGTVSVTPASKPQTKTIDWLMHPLPEDGTTGKNSEIHADGEKWEEIGRAHV